MVPSLWRSIEFDIFLKNMAMSKSSQKLLSTFTLAWEWSHRQPVHPRPPYILSFAPYFFPTFHLVPSLGGSHEVYFFCENLSKYPGEKWTSEKVRKIEIALTATVFKLQLPNFAHLSFRHWGASPPNLGPFGQLLIFLRFLLYKVRQSSLHPDYWPNLSKSARLLGALTGTFFDRSARKFARMSGGPRAGVVCPRSGCKLICRGRRRPRPEIMD